MTRRKPGTHCIKLGLSYNFDYKDPTSFGSVYGLREIQKEDDFVCFDFCGLTKKLRDEVCVTRGLVLFKSVFSTF